MRWFWSPTQTLVEHLQGEVAHLRATNEKLREELLALADSRAKHEIERWRFAHVGQEAKIEEEARQPVTPSRPRTPDSYPAFLGLLSSEDAIETEESMAERLTRTQDERADEELARSEAQQ